MRAQSRVPVRIGLSATRWAGPKRKGPACLITEDILEISVEACEIQSLGSCDQLWSVDADTKCEGRASKSRGGPRHLIKRRSYQLAMSFYACFIDEINPLRIPGRAKTQSLIRALFPEGSAYVLF